jgi:UDP-glucose 4-epimerase
VIAIFCGALLGGRSPKIFGDGKQTRDYVYVGDVVAANLQAAAATATGPFNIGTQTETSVLDLVELLGEIAGVGFEPEFAPARLGELQRSCLEISKAGSVLGWQPTLAIKDGLRATLEASRSSQRQ